MKIRVETMRLDHQVDHEKKYEKTNEIEPEEYQQILCVRGIRAIDPEIEQPEKRRIKVKDASGTETSNNMRIQGH